MTSGRAMAWNRPWEPVEPAPAVAPRTVAPGVPVEDVIGGALASNDAGSFVVISETHPLPLGLSASWPGDPDRRALTTLSGDPELEEFELERALFVDTETTGLAGGTGTYAFLVGCGWVEAGALRVEQYFMRDHADEPALMAHLARVISRFDWTVSFNGKSFDLPLLRTRFIMNRRRTALDALGALDLLHVARRLWRYQLPHRDLGTLEREILGVERELDVPSHEIPEIYFRYLRTGDARELVPVVAHNRVDMVSMAALLARACDAFSDWRSPAAHPAQVLGAARSFALAGDFDAALAAYARALELGLDEELQPLAQAPLSLAHKRRGAWPPALDVWEVMRRRQGRGAVWALVELAKYHEHRAGAFDSARECTVEALAHADRLLDALPQPLARPALEHRLARLDRRLLASKARRPSG
ncbi:MAG: ribonuclease H-like domain-containing protein [Chloroflexi bacterium]|nr:ribonuclease H-like domain-containing protein [Chloroflexota bacterium]